MCCMAAEDRHTNDVNDKQITKNVCKRNIMSVISFFPSWLDKKKQEDKAKKK